jgi:hypothetical protein
MKLFECQACGQPLYFENDGCESCGRSVGFLSDRQVLSALDTGEGGRTFDALASPERPVRFCANAEHQACNWLVPADDAQDFCTACRHNRTIPALSLPENLERWRRLEVAKRRLFYTLLRLRLPLTKRPEDPEGLAFDFLSDDGPSAPPVMTGHASGLITINIAEADDVERERRRTGMGEPYRTLLGHLRHEVGHHYWTVLVERSPDPGTIERFRALFGDERADYGEALKRHYAQGAPPDWPERFISAYASAHPWEDWAETWAHYLHMVDTLETAGAFGITTRPKVSRGAEIATTVDFDPHADGDLEAADRSLAAADLRGQLAQPLHGPAGPLPLRDPARRHRQARLRARLRPRLGHGGRVRGRRDASPGRDLAGGDRGPSPSCRRAGRELRERPSRAGCHPRPELTQSAQGKGIQQSTLRRSRSLWNPTKRASRQVAVLDPLVSGGRLCGVKLRAARGRWLPAPRGRTAPASPQATTAGKPGTAASVARDRTVAGSFTIAWTRQVSVMTIICGVDVSGAHLDARVGRNGPWLKVARTAQASPNSPRSAARTPLSSWPWRRAEDTSGCPLPCCGKRGCPARSPTRAR